MAGATPLRALLQRDGCLTLPGVFDGISARMAASIGFDALYMTGYGVVASALGVADAGTATFTEMLDRVRCIAGATSLPFLADGVGMPMTRLKPEVIECCDAYWR